MRKPISFTTSVALMAVGGAAIVFESLLDPIQDFHFALPYLRASGILLLILGVILFVIRQERQNQRENLRSEKLKTPLSVSNSLGLEEVGHRFDNGISGLKHTMTRLERGTAKQSQMLEQVLKGKAVPIATTAVEEITPTISNAYPNATKTKKKSVELTPLLSEEIVYQRFESLVDPLLSRSEHLPLSGIPISYSCELSSVSRVDIEVSLIRADNTREARAALCYFKCFDQRGQEIEYDLGLSFSEKYGYFTYLKSDEYETVNNISIDLPKHASQLQVNFVKWTGYSEIGNNICVTLHQQNPLWEELRPAKRVRVAAILDEFSYNSFRYECDLTHLDPSTWRQQMDRHQPDLFLCESAWSGRDSKRRPWQGKIYASSNFRSENRNNLLEILSYCKKRGIPTVFWNKEDPSHYDDKIHNFVDTALKFDHIFTTDLQTVDRYKQEHGHRSVHLLPFAVQPRLFNPVNLGERSQDVVFAGGWYSNHHERCFAMETMFDAVINSGRNLKIYDRFRGGDDPSHKFPDPYREYLYDPVANDEVAKVYKESVFGMTINTETRSSSMFARRVFELMACNTFVVSNYSKGIEEYFGSNVIFLDRNPNALETLTKSRIDEAREENLHLVLSKHTYKERFKNILDVAQINYSRRISDCSLVVFASSTEELGAAWNALRKIRGWHGSRTIVAGNSISNLDFADGLTEYNDAGVRLVQLRSIDRRLTPLTEITNTAIDALVLSVKTLVEKYPTWNDVEDYRLHAQYMSAPIVFKEDLSQQLDVQYEIVEVENCDKSFVPIEQLKDHLKRLGGSDPITVYAV